MRVLAWQGLAASFELPGKSVSTKSLVVEMTYQFLYEAVDVGPSHPLVGTTYTIHTSNSTPSR